MRWHHCGRRAVHRALDCGSLAVAMADVRTAHGDSSATIDRQALLTVLTTEYFTL
jgi:hypothetical protein